MKNRAFKFTIISVLCIIFFTACGVVQTPETTPTLTPIQTPTKPTPSPIPYGEVLDLKIALTKNFELYEYAYINDVLLENFSLSVNYEVSMDEADLIAVSKDLDISEYLDEYSLINLLDYADKMPNYISLFTDKEYFIDFVNEDKGKMYSPLKIEFSVDGCGLWMYNEQWFDKYNYDIPSDIEEMVELLIQHKKDYPDSKPIFTDYTSKKETTEKYTDGTMSAFGLSAKRNSSADDNYTKALEIADKMQENQLYTTEYSENIAICYTRALTNKNKAKIYDAEEWKVVSNQFSGKEKEAYIYWDTYSFGYASPRFLIKDTGNNQEVINRYIDYIDWCCTPEGIIATKYGKENVEYNDNGEITRIKNYGNDFYNALYTVNNRYADFIVAQYLSDAYYTSHTDEAKISQSLHKRAKAFAEVDVSFIVY